MSDTLFDLAEFEPKPIYQGRAPLGFTQAYFHPDDLERAHAWEVLERGSFGSAVGAVHTWHAGNLQGWMVPETAEHSMWLGSCSLECFGVGHYPHNIPTEDREAARLAGHRLQACQDVQATLVQAICTVCEWHVIADSYHGETAVVEAWHDHAFPGWRDLPVIPCDIGTQLGGEKKDRARAVAWIEEHYPAGWQREFAPVLSERRSYGTRSVPGRSPWGGYDICGAQIEDAA